MFRRRTSTYTMVETRGGEAEEEEEDEAGTEEDVVGEEGVTAEEEEEVEAILITISNTMDSLVALVDIL